MFRHSSSEMKSECQRSAWQLASNIDGDAWYGDSLRAILDDVTAEQARAHPIPNAHSILEIVVHLNAWITFFSRAVEGTPIPPWPTMPKELDWPPVNVNDDEAWRESVRSLLANHLQFAERIEHFGDERLDETVPGRRYNFSQLFQSASLHAAYHAGQIALLKKMLT